MSNVGRTKRFQEQKNNRPSDRFGRQEGRKCWGEEEKNKKYF